MIIKIWQKCNVDIFQISQNLTVIQKMFLETMKNRSNGGNICYNVFLQGQHGQCNSLIKFQKFFRISPGLYSAFPGLFLLNQKIVRENSLETNKSIKSNINK